MKNAAVQLVFVLLAVTSVHAVKLLQSSSDHTDHRTPLPAGNSPKAKALHTKDTLTYSPSFNTGSQHVKIGVQKPNHDTTILPIRAYQ